MQEDGYVLVIGAAGLDIKGRPHEVLNPTADNPGKVRHSFGGVARNIAENLARLEVETLLLTVVGNDATGDLIMAQAAAAGVDVRHVLQIDGASTGSFVAILDEKGDLAVAVSDYDILEHLTPAIVRDKEALFAGARLAVIDLNLSQETINEIINLTQAHAVPLCVDPTSPAHAVKICNGLDKVYMIAPNITETVVLCGLTVSGHDHDMAINVAKQMNSLGVKIAIVTMGEHGVVYADGASGGHIEAYKMNIVDSTGAGDALSAAVIFGLVNDLPLDEAMRLGVTAASLTLQSRESVNPNLSADALYEHL